MCCSQDTANEKIANAPAADAVARRLRACLGARLGARLGRSDILWVARQRGLRRALEGGDGLSRSRSICSTSSASLSHSRAASSHALFFEGSFVRAALS